MARIDLDDDGERCHVVWQSGEVSQTAVPKLSLGNGLLYLYTKLPGAPWWTDAYYLTTVDFRTGETVYGVLTGTGLGYDNHWAAITIGPDGTAYVGTLRGSSPCATATASGRVAQRAGPGPLRWRLRSPTRSGRMSRSAKRQAPPTRSNASW